MELTNKLKLIALGATRVEVNIKKINNKKIISVKEDMLNSALTFALFFRPIIMILVEWLEWPAP